MDILEVEEEEENHMEMIEIIMIEKTDNTLIIRTQEEVIHKEEGEEIDIVIMIIETMIKMNREKKVEAEVEALMVEVKIISKAMFRNIKIEIKRKLKIIKI
jgi:biotin synthase-related radical SAM superfamily protein